MRYFLSFCVALFCASDHSQAQTKSVPSPTVTNVAGPTYGIYTHVRTNQPYLAMTFDDGPSAEYTPRLLDLLKARHLKATFFLVGKNVEAHPDLVRRIIAEGHEVGDHTWDHPQLSKLSDAQATDEVEKTQDAISAACRVTPVAIATSVWCA
jgi:peptidoglycan/xylan/chitin deacetylase (PgdA/CDA1 family)